MKVATVFVLLLLVVVPHSSYARTGYCGYSGAPGTSGTCAASCHGTLDGTIKISGFPSRYEPLEQYTVKLYRVGGRTIRQFNLSIRVGDGPVNAGTISAGMNTVVYSAPGETNGIHLSDREADSCTFVWTAPEAGTGPVRLYLGGYQGYDAPYGKNTTTVRLCVEKQAPLLTSWGTAALCALILISSIWLLDKRKRVCPVRSA